MPVIWRRVSKSLVRARAMLSRSTPRRWGILRADVSKDLSRTIRLDPFRNASQMRARGSCRRYSRWS